jgi:hypothetical protein
MVGNPYFGVISGLPVILDQFGNNQAVSDKPVY